MTHNERRTYVPAELKQARKERRKEKQKANKRKSCEPFDHGGDEGYYGQSSASPSSWRPTYRWVYTSKKKDNTKRIFCTVFQLTVCFWSRMVCTLTRKRWYHLRVQSSFFYGWYILFLGRDNIITSPICPSRPVRFPTSIFVHWSHECVTLEFRLRFCCCLVNCFSYDLRFWVLRPSIFVAFHRLGILPESDFAFRAVVQKEFGSRLRFSFRHVLRTCVIFHRQRAPSRFGTATAAHSPLFCYKANVYDRYLLKSHTHLGSWQSVVLNSLPFNLCLRFCFWPVHKGHIAWVLSTPFICCQGSRGRDRDLSSYWSQHWLASSLHGKQVPCVTGKTL